MQNEEKKERIAQLRKDVEKFKDMAYDAYCNDKLQEADDYLCQAKKLKKELAELEGEN